MAALSAASVSSAITLVDKEEVIKPLPVTALPLVLPVKEYNRIPQPPPIDPLGIEKSE